MFCPGFGILSTCSHLIPVIAVTETQIPATFPQPHDWDCLRVRERHCLPVCMHALVCFYVCVYVCFASSAPYDLVATTHSQLVSAHPPGRGEPCGGAAVGPLDEMGLLDEVIYTSALALQWSPLCCNSDNSRCKALRAADGCSLPRRVNSNKVKSIACYRKVKKMYF